MMNTAENGSRKFWRDGEDRRGARIAGRTGLPGLRRLAGLALAAVGVLSAPVAHADPVADFYRGKTVTLVIGAGEGGFYDLNGRLAAQYLRKYIPGNPVVVPQNMPGASQLRATEYMYNIAPRDGTSLLVAQPYIILNKLLDSKLKFDIRRFTILGRIGPIEMGGVVAKSAPVHSIEDARQKEVILGGNAPTGPAAMIPWALNRLAGTKFRVVRGYQSQTAEALAMQRGEIQGIGNGALGDFARAHGDVRVLYVSTSTRLASQPGVPDIVELVREDRDRPVMDLLGAIPLVGLPLLAPPGVPDDRQTAQRRAYDPMAGAKDYIASLEKIG
jgi:tripartite-type tricarboxylate transporter receptor subunit TctC